MSKAKIDFFANGLCVACHMAKYELLDFSEFHSTAEKSWEKIDKEVADKVDDLLKNYPEEDRDEIIDSYSQEFYQNQEKYPSIHRKSLVITIYSFVESELDKLCETLSESVDSAVKLKDINGKGIERALLYLSKVAKFDLSKMGKTLPYIKNINQLRNIIVHNGGVLPNDPTHLLNQFISEQKHIRSSFYGTVILDADFIGELIGILVQFFDELDLEVQKHIRAFNA